VSRDVESISHAFDAIDGMAKDSQLQGFPLGHFVGFYLGVENGVVTVSPGEANVGGVEVIQKADVVLEETAWKVTRERGYMYFIYLKKDGGYWVDNSDPFWNSLLNGWYHELLGYRYVGKVFNDSTGKIIYKLSAHYDQLSTIIVGADGFTGYMDYECDGVDDQEEINLALRFASESGSGLGGKVHCTRGYFLTTAAVEGLSNCVLEGEGQGATVIKKNHAGYAISCIGTSVIHKSNFQVCDLTVTRDAADTNSVALIYASYTDGLKISECLVDDAYYFGIHLVVCTQAIVDSCQVVDFGFNAMYIDTCKASVTNNHILSGSLTTQLAVRNGIVLTSCINSIIENNVIGPVYSSSTAEIWAIGLSGCESTIVTGNIVRTIWIYNESGSNPAATGIGMISGSALCTISNNRIEDVASFGAFGHNSYGINIGAVSGCVIALNHAFNNGNLIDRGNCESATPPYLTGEAGINLHNCTFDKSTVKYRNGAASYLFTKTGGAGVNSDTFFHDHDTGTTNDFAGLVIGCSYTFSAWFWLPSANILYSEVFIELADYVPAAWEESRTYPLELYDQWQYVTVTRTMRTTATGCAAFIRGMAAADSGQLFYVDDIRLRPDGVSNEHGQNFSDAGTGTRQDGNSWNRPHQV
jgi:hypothetical protein